MGGWFSLSSLIGMAVALVFANIANRDLRKGLFWYALLGAVPVFQVGAFSGNEMVQGIPLAEVLATVLFGIWLVRRERTAPRKLEVWERCILLMIGASVLSLASGLAWLDPRVPQQNVKLSVSIGQILLFAWPVGIYFVASDLVDSKTWLDRFARATILLAIPQFLMVAVPSLKAYLFWSTYFGLIAAPIALSWATYEKTFWKKAALALFVLPPLIEGFLTGKAFLYGYIVLSSGVILWLRAQTAFRIAVPAIGLMVTLVVSMAGSKAMPGPLKALLEEEEQQQSWGGKNGRGQLLSDAVDVWSGHPVFGVGPANSYPYMIHYVGLGTPHSQYADILLECGIIGLILFVGFVLSVWRWGWMVVHRPREPDSQAFLIAWFASFTAMALVSVTGDYMLHSIRNGGIEMFAGFYIHWVFLGAAVGYVRHEQTARLRAAAPRRVAASTSAGPARMRPRVWVPQTSSRMATSGTR